MVDIAFYEIPLSPSPQVFSVTLNGIQYELTFTWRDAAMGGWMMDIADRAGTPIACGLPLVTGSDLLAQFAYLDMRGGMTVLTDGDKFATPTFRNLGIRSHLFWMGLA